MHPVIEKNRKQIAEMCRRFGVDRLYLFGSAAAGGFRATDSDFDFLVAMSDRRPTPGYADRFLSFADALEKLLGRRVDLVSEESIRNPYFRHEVERTRQLLYGRSLEEAAV
ncbi:MAG: nucleotidyltransferase domain-containing protein [Chloroflexi bacterium]|nr:nucleotidyltransferase domain-containing protein [Chloroflexota bacterium]